MSDNDQNYCTYVIKGITVALAVGGIICSWTGARTCEFISFRDTDGSPLDDADPPFGRAIAANVGIFRYEITEFVNGGGPVTNGCVAYDDRFAQQNDYPSLATAQFCAMIAPIIAMLAVFANLFDFCVCNFPGSYLITSVLFLTAAGIQIGTFTLLADPVFCFEDEELECSQEKGVYLSAMATVLYFLACCLLCCAPRADPFCFNFGMQPEPKKQTRPSKQPHTVVLQPVIIKSQRSANGSKKRQSS